MSIEDRRCPHGLQFDDGCRDCVIDALQAKVEALEEALRNIAEGTTPWMDTDEPATFSWQILARYANSVLTGEDCDGKEI